MLTGESTPLIKSSIDTDQFNDILNKNLTNASNNILFSGTELLQVSHSKIKSSGTVCIVLRTGYNTTQGKILRQILAQRKKTSAGNFEA